MKIRYMVTRWLVGLAMAVAVLSAGGVEASSEAPDLGSSSAIIEDGGSGATPGSIETSVDGSPQSYVPIVEPGLSMSDVQGEPASSPYFNAELHDEGLAAGSAEIEAGAPQASVESPDGGQPSTHAATMDGASMISLYETFWAGGSVNLRAFLLSFYEL